MTAGEWCADFETITREDDCRVWAWGLCPIGDIEAFEYGNDIGGFMQRSIEVGGRIWFHNLRFDGNFILNWLLSNGFQYVDVYPGEGEFGAVIDDTGKYYSINVAGRVTFADSLKKITLSVAQIAKTYGFDMQKGDLDYNKYRHVGHEITPEELDYLRRDVLIMVQAMQSRLQMGDKLTTSSDCLTIFRDLYGKRFRQVFPLINNKQDAACRRAYRGGWCYCSPKHQNETITTRGIRLDVNSLYPSVMDSALLPYGPMKYVKGKPKATGDRPLWIACASMTAHIREGGIPCIQVKGTSIFGEREYVTDIDEPTILTFTNVDFELWEQMYDIDVFEWLEGYTFKGAHGLFSDYVDTFRNEKETAPNAGVRFQAKLKLNSLYGKMAQKTVVTGKIPYLDDGVLRLKKGEETERDGVYLPAGIFITAYARYKTITTAALFGERFCYADTDSIHAIGTDIPEGVEVHPTKFGAWKLEAEFTQARFIRAKTYAERVNGVFEYTCAGMGKGLKSIMRFEDFKQGFEAAPCGYFMPGGCGEDCKTCYNSTSNLGLKPKSVKGGCVLVPTPFSIKGG